MQEVIQKYRVVILIVICSIIFASIKSCVNRQVDELRGKNEQLEEQVKKAQDGTKVLEENRVKLKDSIKAENVKKELELKKLMSKVSASEGNIKYLEKQATANKDKIKNMDLQEVAKTLNETYNSKDATALSSSIDIKNSMPYKILETVVDANTAQEIIKEKDVQLVSKDSIINIKDTQLKDSSTLLISTENSLNSYKEVSELQSDLNKSLEKENSKIRTKSTLNKILIPVAAGIGIIIGNKVAKNK